MIFSKLVFAIYYKVLKLRRDTVERLLGRSILEIAVVDVTGKVKGKCWKVDGTYAPGTAGGVGLSVARYYHYI